MPLMLVVGLLLIIISGCAAGMKSAPGVTKEPQGFIPKSTQTAEVLLQRQPEGHGPRGYAAKFGTRGHLMKISVSPDTKALVYFIKKGHTSDECLNLNAVTPIFGGQSARPYELQDIYGDPTPSLPVDIAACLGVDGVPESFPVTITYTEETEDAAKSPSTPKKPE